VQQIVTVVMFVVALAGPQIICARVWGRDGLNASTLSLSLLVVVLAVGVGVSAFRPSYYNPGGGLGLGVVLAAVIAFVAIGIGRVAGHFLQKKSADQPIPVGSPK
jgi:multisubunit Na+/H+ antiporter MnhB subunit